MQGWVAVALIILYDWAMGILVRRLAYLFGLLLAPLIVAG
jgi:hypothetical protein